MAKATKSDVSNEETVATARYSLRSRTLPYPKPDISGTGRSAKAPGKEAQKLVGVNANPEELQLLEEPDIESRNESQFVLSATSEQQHMKLKLEMKVRKLRRNTVELWGRGDRYKLLLQRALSRWKESQAKERERTKCAKEAELDALAEKAEVEEELREMEERAERAEELAEEVERAAKTDRYEMAEELRAAEERAGRAEAQKADIEARLREAVEQTRRAAEEERVVKSAKADMKELWNNAVEHIDRVEETERAVRAEMAEMKEELRRAEQRAKSAEEAERAARAEKAEVEEELRKAEERVEEAESTDLAKRMKEAEENAARAHSNMMRYWLALTKERRQVQLLQEELTSGEPPAGFAQGPGLCDPLPDRP